MNQTDDPASDAIANSNPKSGSLEITVHECLAFKLGLQKNLSSGDMGLTSAAFQ